jgi:hypothetical protein
MWPSKPDGPHVWLCVGDDSGSLRKRVAFWGGSSLDEVDWNFGGWCVHPLRRGLELAEAVARVIESRPSVPSLVEWTERSWGNGRLAAYAKQGEFNLAVNASRSGVKNRVAHGVCDDAVARGGYDEVVDLWCWWIDLQRPDGSASWCMKSWAAWRDAETAMAHAEQISRALVEVGFGLVEATS